MKRTYLTLIVLMLVVGFAAVSANLVLSGTLKLGFNSEEFEKGVIFTKATSINGTATIEPNNKAINYTTNKLDEIGEESVLDYNITNKSNQYDAEVTINCELKDASSTYEEYIELSNEDINGSFELSAGETKDGRVKAKLKKSYVASDNTQIEFTCTIVATAKEKEETVEYQPETIYTETALNGADPVLEGNSISTVSLEEKEEKKLIPVTIDDEGKVTYADITEKWYDYESQEWANAVILSNYNHIPKVGEVIKEENIESYFVWIPKFKYELWNVGPNDPGLTEPFMIKVEFATENTENTENECVAPNVSAQSGSCSNGKWMTHPAFTSFGDITGFWVGKFEVGYKDAKTSKEAEVDIQDSTKVIIKPNVFSWRSITNKNMFYTLKGYATNLDSHMMKNTEWGAVAILSHSKYGINDGVAQNTNSEYKTGYAKIDNGTAPYNSVAGVKASTTGNITGIYDMSGGAWERMAAYRDAANDSDLVGTSGFTKQEIKSIDKKYFDVYDIDSTNLSYEKRILGDATGEMGPFNNHVSNWHQGYGYFVESASGQPWFCRGGRYDLDPVGASQFSFGRLTGGNQATDNSSRLVLSPQ